MDELEWYGLDYQQIQMPILLFNKGFKESLRDGKAEELSDKIYKLTPKQMLCEPIAIKNLIEETMEVLSNVFVRTENKKKVTFNEFLSTMVERRTYYIGGITIE